MTLRRHPPSFVPSLCITLSMLTFLQGFAACSAGRPCNECPSFVGNHGTASYPAGTLASSALAKATPAYESSSMMTSLERPSLRARESLRAHAASSHPLHTLSQGGHPGQLLTNARWLRCAIHTLGVLSFLASAAACMVRLSTQPSQHWQVAGRNQRQARSPDVEVAGAGASEAWRPLAQRGRPVTPSRTSLGHAGSA